MKTELAAHAIHRTIIAPVVALLVAFCALAASPATAIAQEFQKVEGKLVDDVPAVPFVGIAYGFIWLAVLVYVVVIARGLGRVKTEIDDLRRKLDAAGTPHT
jgi:CcmD family protein